MVTFFQNMAAPALLLTWFDGIQTPEYWLALYATGKLGANAGNIWLLLLVRLVVVGGIVLATKVVVGLFRRMLHRGLVAVAERTGHEQRRLVTLHGLLASALSYLLYFIACILILFTFGITWKGLAPLLGAASILGLAVGFGAQRLVRDLISGLFILGEGQFDIGDWVSIGGVTGRVEEMGLRVTRLRDDQGRAYIIANGDITQVFNSSRGYIKLTLDFTFKRTARLDDALVALRAMADEILRAHLDEVDEDQVTVSLAAAEAEKITLRVTAWAPQHLLGAIERELRRRVLDAEDAQLMTLA